MEDQEEVITHSQLLYEALEEYGDSIIDAVEDFDVIDTINNIDNIIRIKYNKAEPHDNTVTEFHIESFCLILSMLETVVDVNDSFAKQAKWRKAQRNIKLPENRYILREYSKYRELRVNTSHTFTYLEAVTRMAKLSCYNSAFLYHLLSLIAIRIALLEWILHDSNAIRPVTILTLSNEIFQRNPSNYASLRELLYNIQEHECIVCFEKFEDRKFYIRDTCKHVVCKDCHYAMLNIIGNV